MQNDRISSIYIIPVGIVGCLLPLWMTIGNSFFSAQLTIFPVAVFVCGLVLFMLFLKKPRVYLISGNDVAIVLYLGWGILNGWVFRRDMSIEIFTQWFVLGSVYFLCRNISNRLVPVVLLLAGVLQTRIVFLQYTGVMDSQHYLFPVTGNFGNPSQLGGFLAVITVVAGGWFIKMCFKHRYIVWGGLLFLPMLLWGIYQSDSRAAWLACLGGFLYMMLPWKGWRFNRWQGMIVTLFVVAGMLYFYRPVSADSRIYIWRISLQMLVEHPVIGFGVHSFPSNYMLYQADYLHDYPNVDYAYYADQVTSPYNEFIHVLVEQGIPGGLLFLCLFYSFLFPLRKAEELIYSGGIFTFLIFACFSYPGENFPLLYVMAMLMGAGAGKRGQRIVFSGKIIRMCVLLGGLMGFQFIKEWQGYRQADENLSLINKQLFPSEQCDIYKNYPEVLQYILACHSDLPYTIQWKMRNRIAQELPSPDTFCDCGDLCVQLGRFTDAEKYYQTASDMAPSRLRANYGLFNLYALTDRKRQIKVAYRIFNQKVRIVNTFTLRVKEEIRLFIEQK